MSLLRASVTYLLFSLLYALNTEYPKEMKYTFEDEHRLVPEGYLVPRSAWSADSLLPIKPPPPLPALAFLAHLLCLCYSLSAS
ncbi:signaling lymphocytic activation molecule-like isoform X1 [Tachysurus ichikawai]